MSNIQAFNFEDNNVRTISIDGEPYFVAKDVCSTLKLKDTKSSLRKLDDDEKLMGKLCLSGQNRNVWLINESGLYSLTFRSNKVEAKKFRKWVTKEVIPSIRKTGQYQIQPKSMEERWSEMVVWANDLLEQKEAQIKELQPKAEYHDRVLQANGTYTITEIAKELKTSAKRLNELLKSKKVQYNLNGKWILYAQYSKKNYVDYKTSIRKTKNGEMTFTTMVWTELGRKFIYQIVQEYANELPITAITTFSNH